MSWLLMCHWKFDIYFQTNTWENQENITEISLWNLAEIQFNIIYVFDKNTDLAQKS